MIEAHEEFKITRIPRDWANDITDIIFYDKGKEILGQFLRICSVYDRAFVEDVIAFCESPDKIEYSNPRFRIIWDDHQYPDSSIENWAYVDDCTKNNLGRLTTLIPSEFGPFAAYSHTFDKIFIVEQLHRSLINTTQIPRIIEMTLTGFIGILQWWIKVVSLCNNTPAFLSPKADTHEINCPADRPSR